jgi:hypothetical protein
MSDQQAIEFEDDKAEDQEASEPDAPEPEAPKPLQLPEPEDGGAPDWAHVPQGMRFPRGRQFLFIRVPSKWTDTPKVGRPLRVEDEAAVRIAGAGALWRQMVVWSVDVGDMKHAIQRSQGDANRLSEELTKQMIRAVDGVRTDWTGNPGEGSMDVFWNQIGQKNRQLMQRVWSMLNVHTREAQVDFFESCVAVRTPG